MKMRIRGVATPAAVSVAQVGRDLGLLFGARDLEVGLERADVLDIEGGLRVAADLLHGSRLGLVDDLLLLHRDQVVAHFLEHLRLGSQHGLELDDVEAVLRLHRRHQVSRRGELRHRIRQGRLERRERHGVDLYRGVVVRELLGELAEILARGGALVDFLGARPRRFLRVVLDAHEDVLARVEGGPRELLQVRLVELARARLEVREGDLLRDVVHVRLGEDVLLCLAHARGDDGILVQALGARLRAQHPADPQPVDGGVDLLVFGAELVAPCGGNALHVGIEIERGERKVPVHHERLICGGTDALGRPGGSDRERDRGRQALLPFSLHDHSQQLFYQPCGR
jgi:hypothetical protein